MRSGIRSECCLTRRSTKRREKYGRDRTGRKPSFVLSFSLRAPLSYVQIDLLSLSQGTFSLAHVLCRRRVHVTCGFSPRNSLRERESREKGLRGHSLFLRSYSLFASFPPPPVSKYARSTRKYSLALLLHLYFPFPSSSSLSPELRCFPVLTR